MAVTVVTGMDPAEALRQLVEARIAFEAAEATVTGAALTDAPDADIFEALDARASAAAQLDEAWDVARRAAGRC